jgi:RNA polymerase sigma factor (sigma-70 family)
VGDAELIRRAGDGDQDAWDALVGRHAALVWAVARSHRLGDADASDVSQTTWLRLVEHLGRLRDPERVGAWLASTARHECLRVLRAAGRQVPTADEAFEQVAGDDPPPEAGLVRDETDRALWAAFERLPERCRRLLRVLVADPAPSYDEVSAALDMPIGSIGPTRQRCLERLRKLAHAGGITAAPGDLSGGE